MSPFDRTSIETTCLSILPFTNYTDRKLFVESRQFYLPHLCSAILIQYRLVTDGRTLNVAYTARPELAQNQRDYFLEICCKSLAAI